MQYEEAEGSSAPQSWVHSQLVRREPPEQSPVRIEQVSPSLCLFLALPPRCGQTCASEPPSPQPPPDASPRLWLPAPRQPHAVRRRARGLALRCHPRANRAAAANSPSRAAPARHCCQRCPRRLCLLPSAPPPPSPLLSAPPRCSALAATSLAAALAASHRPRRHQPPPAALATPPSPPPSPPALTTLTTTLTTTTLTTAGRHRRGARQCGRRERACLVVGGRGQGDARGLHQGRAPRTAPRPPPPPRPPPRAPPPPTHPPTPPPPPPPSPT